MSRFDVLISGSGVAGAAAALGLAQCGLKVGVIERQLPVLEAGETNARVVALAPASVRILQRLELWPLAAGHATPYRRMEVQAGAHELHFDAAAIGETALGWITDLEALQRRCWRALTPAVRVYAPAQIVEVERSAEDVRVELEDGQRLRARVLIVAEGARSELRTRLGFEVQLRDYAASGLVAQVRTAQRNPGIAFQRFASGGPLALLPLHDGTSSIVWTRPTATAREWLQADRRQLAVALTAASAARFGEVLEVSTPALFPLRMAIADRFTAERVVLLGDSAHVVHPLAGLGLNLGMLDVGALVEVLHRAHAAGRDLGSMATLSRYAAWREGDTRIAAGMVDAVERVFGSAPSEFQQLAERGMGIVDALPLLKRFFSMQAAGLAGRVPQLAL
jgi:ubiquinone biosynthesis UbiH/UbiF/VisC/COQ6 family hydroxylase